MHIHLLFKKFHIITWCNLNILTSITHFFSHSKIYKSCWRLWIESKFIHHNYFSYINNVDEIFLHSGKKTEVETCWKRNKPSNKFFFRLSSQVFLHTVIMNDIKYSYLIQIIYRSIQPTNRTLTATTSLGQSDWLIDWF